jgi:hypothetical protein
VAVGDAVFRLWRGWVLTHARRGAWVTRSPRGRGGRTGRSWVVAGICDLRFR